MKFSKSPLLKTKRLLIKLLEPPEVPLMVKFRRANEHHLKEWEPARSPDFFTERFWSVQSKVSAKQFQNGSGVGFIIMDRSGSQILGVCNYTNVVRGTFQSCHLGYSIDQGYEGRGIMFEALETSNQFIFEHIKLHRIMANYMPRNKRSGSLLKRLGFVIEGRAESFMKINGVWEAHILTSLINSN